MHRISADTARAIFARAEIDPAADYFTLSLSQKLALDAEAKERRYRKPKNANGSQIRYFHAYISRALESDPILKDPQGRRRAR